MFDSGLYVILLRLSRPAVREVGALGRLRFEPGWYAYTGSAKRGLRKRVERHWTRRKKSRWHIDALTTARGADPIGAVIFRDSGLSECELNRLVQRVVTGSVEGEPPAPGFGASDCRAGCPAHLWFSADPVSLLQVAMAHPVGVAVVPGCEREWSPAANG